VVPNGKDYRQGDDQSGIGRTEQGWPRSNLLSARRGGHDAAVFEGTTNRRSAGVRGGITATTREIRGADQVLVRDHEAIGALLTRIGAPNIGVNWQEQRRKHREARRNVSPSVR